MLELLNGHLLVTRTEDWRVKLEVKTQRDDPHFLFLRNMVQKCTQEKPEDRILAPTVISEKIEFEKKLKEKV